MKSMMSFGVRIKKRNIPSGTIVCRGPSGNVVALVTQMRNKFATAPLIGETGLFSDRPGERTGDRDDDLLLLLLLLLRARSRRGEDTGERLLTLAREASRARSTRPCRSRAWSTSAHATLAAASPSAGRRCAADEMPGRTADDLPASTASFIQSVASRSTSRLHRRGSARYGLRRAVSEVCLGGVSRRPCRAPRCRRLWPSRQPVREPPALRLNRRDEAAVSLGQPCFGGLLGARPLPSLLHPPRRRLTHVGVAARLRSDLSLRLCRSATAAAAREGDLDARASGGGRTRFVGGARARGLGVVTGVTSSSGDVGFGGRFCGRRQRLEPMRLN